MLSSIAREARDEFGADRVWCYAARGKLGRRVASGRATGMGLAILTSGAVWAVAPAIIPQLGEGWIFAGMLLCLLGFIWWLVAKRLQSPFPSAAKGWRNAGLVITPKEIGVVQGDLKGRLRWDEIIDLQLGGKVKNLELTSGAERYSIVLSVDGAVFAFGDIYDRPLAIIYERLRNYWRPSQ